MTNHRFARTALALLLAFPLLTSFTAPAVEGYDPLRQITQQVAKANLLIVQDRTGSMAWFPTIGGRIPTAGGTGTGNLYWGKNSSAGYDSTLEGTSYPALQRVWTAASNGAWASVGSYTVPSNVVAGGLGSNCSSTTPSNCRVWTYVLTFEYPSRMSMVKNVLGETVDIIGGYEAPDDPTVKTGGNAFTLDWTATGATTITVSKWNPGAGITTRSPLPFWVYRIDYGVNASGNSIRLANPGAPFSPITANKPKLDAAGNCTVGTCQLSKAANLFENYADQVNWGLLYYNTAQTEAVLIDTTGSNVNLQKLKDYYRAVGDTGPSGVAPLNPDGSTGTLAALEKAKTTINKAIASDTKLRGFFRCDRPYGVILVTDGLSNNGNPSGGNWINPCGSTILTTCDGGSSGYDCPNGWAQFAAKKADDLYTATNTTSTAGAGTINVPVRTWTIGVSANVGPCELDYIAYMGRTDASSPNGRAGFGDWHATENPYIRKTATGVPAEPANPTLAGSTYDGPTGQYKYFRNTSQTYNPNGPSHGHNAYFATTAEALAQALTEILNATATGDYTTSAPVSGLSVGVGSQVYLASTEFPEWFGRLQAFDTSANDPLIPGYLRLWEAGGALKARSTDRAIYTWDPANGNALVRIDVSDPSLFGPTGKLTAIAGVEITSNVGDFIIGNDGTGTKREWLLGPIVNSTPAIVGAPSPNLQTKTYPHAVFEGTYKSRKALLWVGSDDGMLHAFRVREVLDSNGDVIYPGGEEVLALVPPTLLAKQVELYANHVKYFGTSKGVTGQPPSFSGHLYGVANAVRFGDVYSSSWGGYKTVAFVTMGPGFVQKPDGTMAAGQNQLIAIDITHPTVGDPNYDANAPVQVLWTKSLGDSGWSQMAVPWSVPSLAPVDPKFAPTAPGATNWRLLIGTGYNNNNTGGANDVTGAGTGTQSVTTVAGPPALTFNTPEILVLDPVDGSLEETITSMTSPTSPVPYVGNQAFADTVFLDKSAKAYQNDNVADLGLQADLYGRVWFVGASSGISFDSAKIGIDAQAKAGQPQPIYYPPAAGGVGDPTQGTATTPGCTVFAFGSGTLYEKSRYITGPNVGKTGSTGGLANFYPSLYVGAAPKPYPATLDSAKTLANTNTVSTNGLFRATLGSLLRPRWTADTPVSERPFYSSNDTSVPQVPLSPSSQLTAPPYLLVPKSATGISTALFLVYDPEIGCNGYTYVVQIDVQPKPTCNIDQTVWSPTSNPTSTTKINVYGAGVGAASGFTIAGTEVVVAKSGIGEDERAGLVKPPVPASLTGGLGAVKPSWWRELK